MHEFTVYLRGVSFRPIEAKQIVNELEEGYALTLQREASNPHDENAIMVLDPDTQIHLGYVAKEAASELAPLMDEGLEFECKVEANAMRSVLLAITQLEASA